MSARRSGGRRFAAADMMAPARAVCGAVVLGLAALLALPVIAALKGHGGAVTGIAVTSDGARALSAGFDYNLMLWNLAAVREPRRLEGHEAAVAAVAIFPDGRHAVSGSDDGTVGYWDLTAGSLIARWRGHQGKGAAGGGGPPRALFRAGRLGPRPPPGGPRAPRPPPPPPPPPP